MRSFLKEWPQNPHWFGLMGASLNPNNRTTLSQHSRVRHHSVAGQPASFPGSQKLSKRRKGTVCRANYAKTGHLEWFPLSLSLCTLSACLSSALSLSLSVYFPLGSRRSFAFAARCSSARQATQGRYNVLLIVKTPARTVAAPTRPNAPPPTPPPAPPDRHTHTQPPIYPILPAAERERES